MSPKPGWRTTEFWLHAAAGAAIAVLQFLLLNKAQLPSQVQIVLGLGGTAALVALSKFYADGRVQLKSLDPAANSGTTGPSPKLVPIVVAAILAGTAVLPARARADVHLTANPLCVATIDLRGSRSLATGYTLGASLGHVTINGNAYDLAAEGAALAEASGNLMLALGANILSKGWVGLGYVVWSPTGISVGPPSEHLRMILGLTWGDVHVGGG